MTAISPRNEHTVKQFDAELNALRALISKMGGVVCQQVRDASRALVDGRRNLARMVLRREDWVNAMELEADDRFVDLLLTRQPAGPDLRTVLALGKSVRDLERIGDEAQRIAQQALELYGNGQGHQPGRELLRDVDTMSRQAIALLEQSLDTLRDPRVREAVSVAHEEERLSGEFSAGLRRLVTFVLEDSRNVGHVVALALVLRSLERVGNHAHNVAEQVIYQVRGRDVRHLGSAAELERVLSQLEEEDDELAPD